MGHGDGRGDGRGEGGGEGEGKGIGKVRTNEQAEMGAAAFGGLTVCCFICAIIAGIPCLLTGILMVIYGRWIYGVYVCGVILIVIAVIMLVAGIIAGILTYVFANKAVVPVETVPETTVVIAHTQTSAQMVMNTNVNTSPAGYSAPMQVQPHAGQYGMYQPPPQYSAPPPAYSSHHAPQAEYNVKPYTQAF